ncbi:allergen Asp F7 [Verticillium dahliae]
MFYARHFALSGMMLSALSSVRGNAVPTQIEERAQSGVACSSMTTTIYEPTIVSSPSRSCHCAESYPSQSGVAALEAASPEKDTSDDSGAYKTPFEGDMTYYNLGLGSCGVNDGGKDYTTNIVALSHLLIGEESNDNPFCNRVVTIGMGSKTTTAIVRDKCMGCAEEDIDVSMATFNELVGSLDAGRVAVEWWLD